MPSTQLSGRRASRRQLTLRGLRAALQVRQRCQLPLQASACPFDMASSLGIDVWFVDVPTLEGMYAAPTKTGSQPRIFISSHRPSGRQAWTGGHEIGHHVFGHGTRIDQCVASHHEDDYRDPATYEDEEVLADAFAAFLLMPKTAVEYRFGARHLTPGLASPLDVFAISTSLGVGYSSLVYHLKSSLRLISPSRATELLRSQPKNLRAELLGEEVSGNVIVVDESWHGRPVDLEVGDVAIVTSQAAVEDSCAIVEPSRRSDMGSGMLLRALRPGLGVLRWNTRSAELRVSHRRYVGRNMFRHLETDEHPREAVDNSGLPETEDHLYGEHR